MNTTPEKQKGLRLRTVVLFFMIFLTVVSALHLLCRYTEEQEKLKAVYAAETTVRQVEAQINRHLAESDLIRRVVEGGHALTETEFDTLSDLMQDKTGVIKAHELAKDGIVNQIYPLQGNEEALGLDMLQNPLRRKEAQLARQSGQYTIAGPFDLMQGGVGALLFDPIYQNGQFWGFSILVLDWDRFLEQTEIVTLQQAGYRYQIWKTDRSSGEKIVIAQSGEDIGSDMLTVPCEVPNDTWYFEIEPVNGWVSRDMLLTEVLLSAMLAALLAYAYWQSAVRRQREAEHARQIEQMAKQARAANEAKSRFLYSMSHDIRTPMNAIIGFTDLLREHIDEKDRALDYIAKIQSASSFLLSLINYVLEVSRIENGKTTLRDEIGCLPRLIDALNAVFEPDLAAKNLTFTCKTDIEHRYVHCDTTKVKEIFLNILSNSVKYTPAGGHISLTLTEAASPKPGCAAYTAVFTDDGIGMSPEYLPHIFEEFTREHTTTESKVVGTGLGLPIVKSFVDLMGGTIAVQSALGSGTTFTLQLTFPIAKESEFVPQEPPQPVCPAGSLAGKRILMAEDNDLNAEIAMTLLKERGLLVDRAVDGAKCVEMLQAAPEHTYDAILMDIQMPNMDGYAAARAIRAMAGSRSKTPIAAMTANAFDEDCQKALAAGMNAHIVKPLDLDVLFHTLHQLIDSE